MSFNIRLAVDEDGPQLGRLVGGDFPWMRSLDWSVVYPHWLVAEEDGEIRAAVQMLCGRPCGALEFLAVDGSLPPYRQRKIARRLITTALHVMIKPGVLGQSQAVFCFVTDDARDFAAALKRHGGVSAASGEMIVRRFH